MIFLQTAVKSGIPTESLENLIADICSEAFLFILIVLLITFEQVLRIVGVFYYYIIIGRMYSFYKLILFIKSRTHRFQISCNMKCKWYSTP